jgi:hypothetical protein
MQAIGLLSRFYQPTTAQANVLAAFSADLVQDISSNVRQAVNRQVRAAALGIQTPFEAMQALSVQFGTTGKRQVVPGVTAKAETVVRTELQRAFNLANRSQQVETAKLVPDLRKRWIATGDTRTRRGHLEIHNATKDTPIPVDEPFIVRNWQFSKKSGWSIKGSARLDYPLDPQGPGWATINCRCTMATIHPQIGVIGSTLDGNVSRMLKRAEDMDEEQD